MSATNNIVVSEELYREVSQRAEEIGLTPQDWASSVLSARIQAERLTDDFFMARVAGASSEPLGRLLDKAPDRPLDVGDELLE
jgi:hypothetical protein